MEGIYVTFDKIALKWFNPWSAPNDGAARRKFKIDMARQLQEIKMDLSGDYQIWKIGNFDPETGALYECSAEDITEEKLEEPEGEVF